MILHITGSTVQTNIGYKFDNKQDGAGSASSNSAILEEFSWQHPKGKKVPYSMPNLHIFVANKVQI